jgi:hypothetical protein
MDSREGPQVGPERRTCPFAGIAVDLASAITIVIAGPFMHPVVDSAMGRMAATIALPCVCVEHRATNLYVRRGHVVTDAFGRAVADPEAVLARAPRDDADGGGTIVGIGPIAATVESSPQVNPALRLEPPCR